MKKRISIIGFVLAAFYLVIVLFLHLLVKHCIEIDGMFCGIWYAVAGLPWTWIFLSLADALLPEYPPAVEQKLFREIFFTSILINSLVIYLIGRFISNAIARRKMNFSSHSAT